MTPPPAMVACDARESEWVPDFDQLSFAPHLDESVELLVSTNGELQMAGSDTLHLRVGRGSDASDEMSASRLEAIHSP